jgi:CubicO group peptidase (beta-lactamase class C family)
MKLLLVGCTALLSTCLVSASRPADDVTQRIKTFDRYLDALRLRARIPGLSAAIVQDGRIIWEQGQGYQDVERRLPARPDTPYRIASLTKTFASTLLMQCVERDTIHLNDPMRSYTSEIPEAGATVQHVLTHTSEGTPGAQYRYNGARYGSLSSVVQACTGKPFRVALADAILEPLAMRDSVPGQDLESQDASAAALFDAARLERYRAVLGRIAVPYLLDSRNRMAPTAYPPKGINAAAGLVSTVRDIARFDAAIDSNFLVRADTLALAWTPVRSITTGAVLPHALGWFTQDLHGRRIVWHYGYWAQFSALYVKVPDQHLTLILLANSGGLSSYFPIGDGDVTVSPFAKAFLRIVAKVE